MPSVRGRGELGHDDAACADGGLQWELVLAADLGYHKALTAVHAGYTAAPAGRSPRNTQNQRHSCTHTHIHNQCKCQEQLMLRAIWVRQKEQALVLIVTLDAPTTDAWLGRSAVGHCEDQHHQTCPCVAPTLPRRPPAPAEWTVAAACPVPPAPPAPPSGTASPCGRTRTPWADGSSPAHVGARGEEIGAQQSPL